MDEKVDLESKDIKKDQVQKLKEVFPEVVSEDKVDFEKLRLTLGDQVETGKERYGMNWPGKANCFKIIQEPSNATLKPEREDSVDFDTTENLFIEGDSLEVLKLLQSSYYGKVKMIYIDPPYNTGNDFVYPDNYSESLDTYLRYTGQKGKEGLKLTTNTETEGRYHSKWMNMMYVRLFLAKNLLKEDGVIFISIDDHEIDNLKKICNEIFEDGNFIGQITVVNDARVRDYGSIAPVHEYLLAYSKSSDFEANKLFVKDKQFQYEDKDGGFDIYELRNRNIRFNDKNRPNLFYPFWVNEKSEDSNGFYEISIDEKDGWVKVLPAISQGAQTVWRWGKEKSTLNLNKVLFAKKNSSGGYQIVKKYRESNEPVGSVWAEKEVLSDRGTLEVKFLFDGVKVFDFPKPVGLIKKILKLATSNDSIIIDFFAGSATAAHAVLDLNKEDGGNRKFIMVQLQEPTDENSEAYRAGYKNIAEIGKERIRRVIKKIKEEKEGQLEHDDKKIDLGFRVFKLDESNFKVWEGEKPEDIEKQLELYKNNLKDDSKPEDILYELILKSGFEVSCKVEELEIAGKKVYSVEDGQMMICLDRNITKELMRAIAEKEPARMVCLDEGFEGNDALLTNSAEIMKAKGIEFRTV